MDNYECDTVIVGGGIAGITAALELLDQNQSIVIVDRDKESNFGGLAKESFGGMLMINTPEQRRGGIKDSPELAVDDWFNTADFCEADTLPKAWAKSYTEESLEMIYHWLKEKGIKFFPVVHWVERGLYTPGNSVPRFHMVWGTGWALINTLVHALHSHPKANKLQLLFEHCVDDLHQHNKTITGCSGHREHSKQPFSINAGNVIVASGGINGCMKKVRDNWDKEWSTPPETILNGSHHFADGLLHDVTANLGGKITHLDKQWNYAAGVHHPHPRRPNHGLSLVPCPSALWVNKHGDRIGPEPMVTGFDTRRLVTQVCQQPDQFSWQVLNRKIAIKELAISGAEYNDSIKNKNLFGFLKMALLGNKSLVSDLITDCEDFVIGESIEELASKMNELDGSNSINPNTLKQTIHRYDNMIRQGTSLHNDDQLRRIRQLRQYRGNKVRTCKFQPIDDNSNRPLIAIRQFILSRKSLGGIQTNLKSQVLNTHGEAIPGLYAIGEAAGFGGGGIHGKRTLEGTFLGGCILTARKSAQAITKSIGA